MWAALFRLMLVCSTMTWPGPSAPFVLGEASRQLASERRPVEEQVHVAAARDFRAWTRGRGELRRQPLGDLTRLAAEGLREVEGGGQGEVAQLDPGRVLEGDVLEVDVESGPCGSPRRAGEELLEVQDHSSSSYRRARATCRR
jgi:hypothetical protein